MKLRLNRLIQNTLVWYRRKRAFPHASGWDNPANGHDLLAAMIKSDQRRKEPLP